MAKKNKNLADYKLFKEQPEKVQIIVENTKAKSWEQSEIKIKGNPSCSNVLSILRNLKKIAKPYKKSKKRKIKND